MHAEAAYLFRHALLREAAYQLQLPGDRARLHTLALEIIERLFDAPGTLEHHAADLAQHARLAQSAHRADSAEGANARFKSVKALAAKEARFIQMAAAHARDTHQMAEAARLFDEAARHESVDGATRALLGIEAARLHEHCGNPRLAELALNAAEPLALTPEARGLLLLERASLQSSAAQTDLVEKTLEEACIALGQAGDNAHISTALGKLAALYGDTGRPQEEEALLKRAWKHAEESQAPLAIAGVGTSLAWHMFHSGRREEAERQLEHVEAACAGKLPREKQLGIINARAVFYVQTSRVEQAERLYRECIEIAARMGAVKAEAMLIGNLGNLHYYYSGRLEEAEECYRRSQALSQEAGDLVNECEAVLKIAAMDRQRDRLKAVPVRVLELLELTREARLVGLQLKVLDEIAAVHAHLGDAPARYQAQLRALQLARAEGNERDLPKWLSLAADSITQLGRLALGLRWRKEALEILLRVKNTTEFQPFASQAKFLLILGDLDGARAAAQITGERVSAADTPQHYINSVLSAWFGIRIAEATGLWPRASKPETGSLSAARAIFAQMRDMAGRNEVAVYGGVRRAIELASAVMAEIDAAGNEGRAPLIFNGAAPANLNPLLRLALLARLGAEYPEDFKLLQTSHGALYAAMLQGTQGLPMPDWRSETL